MSACTFFGHRNCPDTIKPKLYEALTDLIVNHSVTMFYVGNQGHFDAIVRSTLRELEKYYPQIDHAVVLAYLPHARDDHIDSSDTMFPEGLESVHPRYAISRRNDWMLRHSDYVITYFTHTWGGAYQYAQKARRQSKNVIDIR